MKELSITAIILLVAGCCFCLCISVLCIGALAIMPTTPTVIGYSTQQTSRLTPTPIVVRPTGQLLTATPVVLNPLTPIPQPTALGGTDTFTLPTSNAPATPTPKPVTWPIPTDTLNTLEQVVVPINDLLELAERLEGKDYIPATIEPPPAPYRTGTVRTFWVTNVDTNENFQVDATLRYVTDHTYFWIEDGVSYNQGDLADLAEAFENEIYPTNREFFGSEWSPGVDGDPHIYILYAGGLGWNIAGYFSSADEYHPLAHEYSNTTEMFLFSADNVDLDEAFTYGVLAHEFQHMIHWYQDRNESSWLNEGFSELAALLNGYYEGGPDWEYASNPDRQLTDWPNDGDTYANYGSAFLFVSYFLDRFGEEATKALVAHPSNGMTSVDLVLEELSISDPLNGQPITADDVFQDWILTNYIQDSDVSDGRYEYYSYSGAPAFDPTRTISTCPLNDVTTDVNQYGVDYIRIQCEGDYTLHFEGSVQVNVLPADPLSGDYYFWSNKGDESDMTLTRQFDFSGHSGPLTFSYWTWYDLETDYDYVYLEASTDGEDWQILTTPSGTPEDPSGNSYGWGYNSLSGGGNTSVWIQESVDISQFAGQTVYLRFEYVTDAAVNGEGLVLDDISIPEAGYFTDFEDGADGWESAGWVRIQNLLPQTFRLALIHYTDAGTTVEYITLNEDITADISISIGSDEEIILVIGGTTRFTRMPAAYRYSIQP